MFKKLLLTFLLFFCSLISIYPSKKENTDFLNYCYSFEKILARNSLEKSNNLSKNFKGYAKDITLFGANKTKGFLANKIIDQYKNDKKIFFINFVHNQVFCLGGYWVEFFNPGTFKSIFYENSKQRINKYKNIIKESDEYFNDIHSEYESLKKEINKFFR